MKKIIVFMILMLIPIFTFADETDTSQIVKSVKEKLQITEQYSNMHIQPEGDGYFLSGFDGNSNVRISVDKNLVITRYVVYSDKQIVKKLPKINKKEATQTALAFAVRVANDVISQLDTGTPNVSFSNGGYNVRFERRIDGVHYKADGVNIFINGGTGVVERYDKQFTTTIPFASAKKILDANLAKQKYIENIGLELRYSKKIVDKKVSPYLVYVPYGDKMLDAVTGQSIAINKKLPTDGYFDVASMYEKNTKNVIDSDDLISVSQAQSKVRGIAQLGIDDSYVPQQAKYLRNSDDEYLISLSFENDKDTVAVTLDAKTSIVKEFSKSDTNVETKGNNEVSFDNINSYMTKYMQDYKDSLYAPIISADVDTVVLYERMVNGVPYKSNGIYFVISANGDIKRISFAWDNVYFPPVEGAITKAQAYNSFFENVGLELTYSKISNEKISPVYISNTMSSGIIDALTGNVLNYDGKELQQRKRLAYVGPEDHYARMQAEALANCDIYVSQGNVVLDNNISQKDYILLISEFLPAGKPIIETFGVVTDEQVDTVYNYFVTNKIMDKNEVRPNSFVTRTDAVKYLLRVLGYKDVAELNAIFKNHFLDNNKIDPNLRGYVELARGLNLIGGEDGYFKPNDYLTNGDGLIIVYNYLNRGGL